MMRERIIRAAFVAAGLAMATVASAQLFTPFPPQNPRGPTGIYQQENYPYPGQCAVDPTLFNVLGNDKQIPQCDLINAPSFACEPGGSGFSNQTAGTPGGCGTVVPFNGGAPIAPLAVNPAGMFKWEVLNPPDYTPETTKFPGAHYYEIALHESWGFQAIAAAGLFPNPTAAGGAPVPDGKQWTGILDAANAPVYTPIWGVGQKNMNGGPVTTVLRNLGLFAPPATRPEYSPNDYIATWPSISIRGSKGTPVVVRWVNEFPNNHVFCPHPEAADWPCAIDRTFMGVKAAIDPATAPASFHTNGLKYDGVNQFGSAQQPDNSWVTHLHGGEIPPSTDGFAEKWFGNVRTGRYFSPQPWLLNPLFDSPTVGLPPEQLVTGPGGTQYGRLFRPGGDPSVSGYTAASTWMNDTYTYPMVQDEALIWFHDHTLGKTHHNVIAGPAGFFPVVDPAKHYPLVAGVCQAPQLLNPPQACPYLDPVTSAPLCDCEYTWLDPVTIPRDGLGIPKYDLFLAIQDRAFNADGSISFPTGMGQTPAVPAAGVSPITPGVNPQVHPVWVPEYFGDHALVNGVAWPKKTTEPGWYRIRIVDGSDSRCYTMGLSTVMPAPGTAPGNATWKNTVPIWVVANDQGYLQKPVKAAGNAITMCPGERLELLVNFAPYAGTALFLTNSAAAPFPAGVTPAPLDGVDDYMNVIMRFDVMPVAAGLGVPSCTAGTLTTWPPVPPATGGCMVDLNRTKPALTAAEIAMITDNDFVDLRGLAATATVRQVYLNERVDGTTGFPLGMQLNGVPFEYKVTEVPKKGTVEVWDFINLTVDTHPMHPHLVKHQIVQRQNFNVGRYKAALCGSTTCQPGTAPGNEMQVVPDVRFQNAAGQPFLTGNPTLVTAANVEGGFKDVTRAPPGQVTTIIARWDAGWAAAATPNGGTAPGMAAGPVMSACPGAAGCSAAGWTYEPVTAGPYVWHCHINSHEDSEMMRTSLVLP